MYPVSEAYKTDILKNDRVTRITGSITLSDGTEISLSNNDFDKAPEIQNQCVSGDDFELGQVYQGQVIFTIYSNLERHRIYDAQVTLVFELWIPEREEWEEVPLGIYFVSECIIQGANKRRITCLDNMGKLDKDIDSYLGSGTPYNYLQYISLECGVELGQTAEEIALLPNGNKTFSLPLQSSIKTYRDLLHDISVCIGAFATIDRLGKLQIKRFSSTPAASISADYRGNDVIADYQIHYTSVSCNKKDVTIVVGDEGKCLDLGDNEFLQSGTEHYVELILTDILGSIADLYYIPSSITLMKSDPSYELGDLLEVSGYTAGNSTLVSVQKIKWSWRGELKLEGVGKDPRIGKTVTREQKKVQSQLDKGKENGLTYYNFTNISEIEINDIEETKIIDIEFAVTSPTTVMMLHELKMINHLIDDTQTVTLFFYHNDDLINFQPANTYSEDDTYHFFTSFYTLLNVMGGVAQNWKVTAMTSSGTAVIGIDDAKATIFGQKMVAEDAFKGTIKIEDEFTPVKRGRVISSLTDNMSPRQNPIISGLAPVTNARTTVDGNDRTVIGGDTRTIIQED